MAHYKQSGYSFTANAAANYSARTNLHRIVAITADHTVTLTANASALAVGVLAELHPDGAQADNRAVTIETGGIVKVRLGSGGITAGAKIRPAANGLGVASGATSYYVGVALHGGQEGEVVAMLWQPGMQES